MDFSFLGGQNAQGNWAANPMFLQMLAQMGTAAGQGKSAGEVIGGATSNAIRAQGMQGVGDQIIPQLQDLSGLQPTPVGQAGPDAVTTKRTADGTTTTVQTPSERNLSTFGSSVPAEAQASGGVSDQNPFLQALLKLSQR